MSRWLVKEEDFMKTVENIWNHYPFVQALLGPKLYEQMMTDVANLTFRVQVPENAKGFYIIDENSDPKCLHFESEAIG